MRGRGRRLFALRRRRRLIPMWRRRRRIIALRRRRGRVVSLRRRRWRRFIAGGPRRHAGNHGTARSSWLRRRSSQSFCGRRCGALLRGAQPRHFHGHGRSRCGVSLLGTTTATTSQLLLTFCKRGCHWVHRHSTHATTTATTTPTPTSTSTSTAPFVNHRSTLIHRGGLLQLLPLLNARQERSSILVGRRNLLHRHCRCRRRRRARWRRRRSSHSPSILQSLEKNVTNKQKKEK